jgi:hypothetical protein
MSAAVIAAVNFVAFTNVVTRGLPFHCTTELLTKLLPFTVNVNPGEPALNMFGVIVVIAGNGLFAAVIVNVAAADVPPPGVGFVTVTPGVPAVATSVAKTGIVNCVALIKVVVRAVPLKFTTEVEMKFVPITTSVNPDEPAAIVLGDNDVIVGAGFVAAVTVNVAAADVPPPGARFVTVTEGVPTVATSIGRIVAVSCVEFTNVVTAASPLNVTRDPFTKFVPFTVNVNDAEPAAMVLGDNDDIVGTGLFIWNGTTDDVPPPGPGFVTVTDGVPVATISVARIAAVI